jgi:hypothetical protein
VVANSLFITGANAEKEKSKKKELRKENRERKTEKGKQRKENGERKTEKGKRKRKERKKETWIYRKSLYAKGHLQRPWRAARSGLLHPLWNRDRRKNLLTVKALRYAEQRNSGTKQRERSHRHGSPNNVI